MTKDRQVEIITKWDVDIFFFFFFAYDIGIKTDFPNSGYITMNMVEYTSR